MKVVFRGEIVEHRKTRSLRDIAHRRSRGEVAVDPQAVAKAEVAVSAQQIDTAHFSFAPFAPQRQIRGMELAIGQDADRPVG